MGARLPPGEAERRAKERARRTWSGENYKRYNPDVDGYGSPDEWERIADELFGRERFADNDADAEQPRATHKPTGNRFLDALGLHVMPSKLVDLVRAFRAAMFKAHPDYGGTNEAARAVLEAYAYLKRKVGA